MRKSGMIIPELNGTCPERLCGSLVSRSAISLDKVCLVVKSWWLMADMLGASSSFGSCVPAHGSTTVHFFTPTASERQVQANSRSTLVHLKLKGVVKSASGNQRKPRSSKQLQLTPKPFLIVVKLNAAEGVRQFLALGSSASEN